MQTNFISRILKHKTAANLFLILMFILGLYSSKELNTQFFPNYSIDYITVNMNWVGASPVDIEESLIKPIEEKVRYLDKVKNIIRYKFSHLGISDLYDEVKKGKKNIA